MAGLLRPNTDDFSVFVGDLAADVTDYVLQETFRQFFPSVRSAKVITDPATGRSKGYGFVRFANEVERDRALDMQGFHISNRPIRVSLATARRNPGPGGAQHPAELDPGNTTLFIGGLSTTVTEDQLRAIFSQYGEVVYTKIPQGKGCGFVQFQERMHAEMAMTELNGQVLGTSAIRISWGRSTSRAAAGGMRPAGAPPHGMPGYPPYNDAFAAAPAAGAAAAAGPGAYSFPPAAAGYGYAAAAVPQYGVDGSAAAAPGYAGYATGAYAAQLAPGMQQMVAPDGQVVAGQVLPGQPQYQQVYNPNVLTDINKANALYIQQQQPQLMGTFLQRP